MVQGQGQGQGQLPPPGASMPGAPPVAAAAPASGAGDGGGQSTQAVPQGQEGALVPAQKPPARAWCPATLTDVR
jgi:hypothetical protein